MRNGWEGDALHRKSAHCLEVLGPHSTLPSPSRPRPFACIRWKRAFGAAPRRQSQLSSPFPLRWQGSRWSARGGEFTGSLLSRDTELLTLCYVCAALPIYFTFPSIFPHSFKQVMRPTGKEEEKQEKAAGGFTRKGPRKGNGNGDHAAL